MNCTYKDAFHCKESFSWFFFFFFLGSSHFWGSLLGYYLWQGDFWVHAVALYAIPQCFHIPTPGARSQAPAAAWEPGAWPQSRGQKWETKTGFGGFRDILTFSSPCSLITGRGNLPKAFLDSGKILIKSLICSLEMLYDMEGQLDLGVIEENGNINPFHS